MRITRILGHHTAVDMPSSNSTTILRTDGSYR
jgi:hypothetical protein